MSSKLNKYALAAKLRDRPMWRDLVGVASITDIIGDVLDLVEDPEQPPQPRVVGRSVHDDEADALAQLIRIDTTPSELGRRVDVLTTFLQTTARRERDRCAREADDVRAALEKDGCTNEATAARLISAVIRALGDLPGDPSPVRSQRTQQ